MSSAVFERFNRHFLTKDSIWNNQDKADALVFKVCMVCGIFVMFLPWGGQA